MPAFLDVHSHMVPSGDDGVRNEADGLELCAEAARRGTTVLYATPHVWPHFTLGEEREREVRAAHARMAPKAAGFGLDLRLGWELTPAPALLDEDLRRYRFQGLPAVLMELPFAGPLGLAERVAAEIEEAGLVPIIGHPERADGVIDDPDVARGYVERGWLLQVNGTSLTGAHGRNPHETGWFLVEEGLAGLMGSDGHRPRRPPFLDEAYELARERIGEDADDLFAGAALARAVERAA